MSASPTQSLVLSFEDARRVVEEHAAQIASSADEVVDLLHASGRILAEAITADRDIPPFPRSTRDGYAVRSADLTNLPARLTVAGEIKAGPRPGFFHHDRRTGATRRGRRRDGGIHVFGCAK